MKARNKQKLILSLIKDDLINSKLVDGLNAIGLSAETYFLNLSDTIFKLMDFEDTLENEPIYEHYLELSRRAKYIDISESHQPLDDFVIEIYNELLAKKLSRKP